MATMSNRANYLLGRIWDEVPGSVNSFYRDLAEDLLDRCEAKGVNIEDILEVLEGKYLQSSDNQEVI